MKIIFDYNRTLFDPETDALYPGVFELLEKLAKDHELLLVSRNEPSRKGRLKELGIAKFFERAVFVEEKTPDVFLDLADGSREVIVIGDRVNDEIAVGKSLGFATIHIRQGKFSGDVPAGPHEQPTHSVENVRDIGKIIATYED